MRPRDELLDAAAQEIVRHGYAASSLSSIASHLGLTKGALVRHFPTKEQFAWGVLETFRQVVIAEERRSVETYPHSGVRALTRFLLALADDVQRRPQVAAAVVLMTDRASPTFRSPEVLEDWMRSLRRFVDLAAAVGELPADADLQELAEFIFLTNMGTAAFGAPDDLSLGSTRRFRFLRVTLRSAGVIDADALIDDALTAAATLDLPLPTPSPDAPASPL